MEQKTLSSWLKIILAGIGVCGLLFYFWLIPHYGRSLVQEYPEFAGRFKPWLLFLWVSGIPCYSVLVLGWRIASGIGRDRSFSADNSRYLKWISWLAASDGVFFFVGNVLLLLLGQSHPGIALASLLVVFAGVSISVAAAVLSHLVRKAAALQEQSDLTI